MSNMCTAHQGGCLYGEPPEEVLDQGCRLILLQPLAVQLANNDGEFQHQFYALPKEVADAALA